jgi:WD40 repeat protein
VSALPNGRILAYQLSSGNQELSFHSQSPTPVEVRLPVSSQPPALHVSHNGRWLVIQGQAELHIVDLEQLEHNPLLGTHAALPIYQSTEVVALSADSKWLIAGLPDRSVRRWNLDSAGSFTRGPINGVSRVELDVKGRIVLTATQTGQVLLTDLVDRTRTPASLAFGRDLIPTLALSRDGKWALVADHWGNATIWQIDKARADERARLQGVFAAQFGSDCSRLWTSDDNGQITAWSLSKTGQWQSGMTRPSQENYKERIGTSLPQLALAGSRWLVLTKRNNQGVASSTVFEVTDLREHYRNDKSNILAISRDGRWLVTTDPDGVGILDLTTARTDSTPHTIIPRPDIPPSAAAFSPDGKRFAISQPGLPIRVYQTAAWGDEIEHNPQDRVFKFDVLKDSSIQAQVVSLAISPDGHWLMTGGKDGSVYVFDLIRNALASRLPVYQSEGVVVNGVFRPSVTTGTSAHDEFVTVTDRGVTRQWRIDLLDPKNFGSIRTDLLSRAGSEVLGRNFQCDEWKAIFWTMPFEPTFANREPRACPTSARAVMNASAR